MVALNVVSTSLALYPTNNVLSSCKFLNFLTLHCILNFLLFTQYFSYVYGCKWKPFKKNIFWQVSRYVSKAQQQQNVEQNLLRPVSRVFCENVLPSFDLVQACSLPLAKSFDCQRLKRKGQASLWNYHISTSFCLYSAPYCITYNYTLYMDP